MEMDWNKLLSDERFCDKIYEPHRSRSIFVQDHDRIVFSAPFRRLANKAQVQPLYEHDHIHHRLIHSVEVSSVGRSLAMRIGNWLEDENKIKLGEASNIANIVQAACVAHDIGNPPFGHSGEASIGDWFNEKFCDARGLMADISDSCRAEFVNFEGNAQGFRIISRLEMYRNEGGMRLSKATLGAFTKYPVLSHTRNMLAERGDSSYIGLKKFGIFNSEFDFFKEIANSLGLPKELSPAGDWWRRHPLVFIVEAADDICYNIVDLEDAFTTGELTFEVVKELLHSAANQTNRDVSKLNQAEHIAILRAIRIGCAIDSCFDAFKNNYDEIMAEKFSSSLTDSCKLAPIFAKMKEISRAHVFTARRKTELEVSGRRVIDNVMSGLLPVFENLAVVEWNSDKLTEYNRQLVRALDLDLRDVTCNESALHAIADFTSGMTDRYAVRIARMLTGI